jgi:hypothetical protein
MKFTVVLASIAVISFALAMPIEHDLGARDTVDDYDPVGRDIALDARDYLDFDKREELDAREPLSFHGIFCQLLKCPKSKCDFCSFCLTLIRLRLRKITNTSADASFPHVQLVISIFIQHCGNWFPAS